jgi:cell division protein FtsQ
MPMNLRFLALGRGAMAPQYVVRQHHARQRAAAGATRKGAAQAQQGGDFSLWLNRALVLFGATVVLFAGFKTYRWIESLPVEQIVVTGELEHVQKQAVQNLVQQTLSGGFLHADLQSMREELERLPWVFEATVRRQWPNALQIHVKEQLPIARWRDDAFLNHRGGLFRPSGTQDWGSLPLLSGPEGSSPELMAKYLRLVDIVAPLGLSVSALQLDERGEIEAVLSNGVRLVLGNEAFLERMHRFVTVYRQELASRVDAIARIDLRYETGLAVAYREDSQVAGL